METPAVPALLIGALFVEKGLITQEQLDVALEEQRSTGDRLGEILVERFGVSRLDLASALAEQWAEYERQGVGEPADTKGAAAAPAPFAVASDESSAEADVSAKRPIGEFFVERGLITADDLDGALEEQKTSGQRLGEILVARGNLSRLELASALADQWATFQKLRPPAAVENGGDADRAADPVMPTPEVTRQPFEQTVVSPDVPALRERIEALAEKLELLAAPDWRQPLEALTASHDERLDAIEQSVAEGAAAAIEPSLRDELAALGVRVDELSTAVAALTAEPPPPDLPGRIEALAGAIEQQETRLTELASQQSALDTERGGRQELEVFESRLDSIATDSAQNVEDVRSALAALAAQVDERMLPDEWRAPLDSLADELRARLAVVESTPEAASTHAVDGLRAEITELTARIDAAPAPAPSDAWRDAVNALDVRLEALADQRAEALDQLRAEIDGLAGRLDAVPVPSEEWRGSIEALGSRVEALASSTPASLEELKVDLATLAARLDAAPQASDEWREGLAGLAARLDALPAPSDEWRVELGLVAENLRARLERVEADLVARADDGVVADLGSRLGELADRLPAGLDELRAGLAVFAARLDALPAPSDEWRVELGLVAENLRARLERVEADLVARADDGVVADLASRLADLGDRVPEGFEELHGIVGELSARIAVLPSPGDEWREELVGLAARIDGLPLPTDEWRVELGQVAQNVRERFDRLEADLASGVRDTGVAELTAFVQELAQQVGDLSTSREDWRGPLDGLGVRIDAIPADLGSRLDRVDGDLSTRARQAAVADLSSRFEEVAGSLPERFGQLREAIRELEERVEGVPAPTGEWRVELAQVAENLRVRLERVEGGLEQRPGFELLAGLRDELHEISHGLERRLQANEIRQNEHGSRLDRLAEQAASVESVGHRLHEELGPFVAAALEPVSARAAALAAQLEQQDQRLEQTFRRLEELRDDGPSAADVAAALGARLDASDALAADALASFDDRLAALDERLEASLAHSGSAMEALRHELDDARGVTAAAAAASSVQTAQLAEALRSEIAAVAAVAEDYHSPVEQLGSLVTEQANALESLRTELREHEARLDKGLGKRAGDVAALATRLDEVESAVAAAHAGRRDAASETAEAVGRLDRISGDLAARLAELEKAQAKRSDVRDLREALGRVEQRITVEGELEETRVHAVEEALRDGLASLGARLAETEGAYFAAGDALRRSIVQLGSAIRAADQELAPATAEVSAPTVSTSFLAFAPTPEGYRLVEVDGAPPASGDAVEVPGCELQLVVARIGSSPLPFDRRACAYLEPRA